MIVAEDSPKFVDLPEYGALVATGRADICDAVQAAVMNLLCTKGMPIDELIFQIGPIATRAYEKYPDRRTPLELSVALIAADRERRVVRILDWSHEDGFCPTERVHSGWRLLAYGQPESIQGALQSMMDLIAAEKPADIPAVKHILQRVLARAAAACDGINASAFWRVVQVSTLNGRGGPGTSLTLLPN